MGVLNTTKAFVLKNLSDYKEEQAGYSEDYESIYRDPYQHAQKTFLPLL